MSDKFDYAWRWFEYHAEQRLKTFRFFLVIFSALGAAFGSLVTKKPDGQFFGMAAVCAIFGVVVSVGFWILDIRNTELVNYGRRALEHLERSKSLQEIYGKSEDRSELLGAAGPVWWILSLNDFFRYFTKHEWWFRFIYFCCFIISCTAFLYVTRTKTYFWRLYGDWVEGFTELSISLLWGALVILITVILVLGAIGIGIILERRWRRVSNRAIQSAHKWSRRSENLSLYYSSEDERAA